MIMSMVFSVGRFVTGIAIVVSGILQAADILSKGIAQMIPTLTSACIVIISVSKLTKPSHITHQCERTNRRVLGEVERGL